MSGEVPPVGNDAGGPSLAVVGRKGKVGGAVTEGGSGVTGREVPIPGASGGGEVPIGADGGGKVPVGPGSGVPTGAGGGGVTVGEPGSGVPTGAGDGGVGT